MKTLFSRKGFGFLGVSILVLSVMLCLVYEAKSQAGASANASANWFRARGAIDLYFDDDPEFYPVGKMWRGQGTAKAGRTWGDMSVDSGVVYVQIVSLTLSSPTVPPGGIVSTSENIYRLQERRVTWTKPFMSKCALARGSFAGNTLRGRIASYPQ